MTIELPAVFSIRTIDRDDRAWVAQLIREQWRAEYVVVHGTIYRPDELPGLAAVAGNPIGLITYRIDRAACEIVTLNSLQPNRGIGTALIERVVQLARESGCRRVWLITSNENLDALGFYQKRGFALAALHRGAVEQARKLKPEIPLVAKNGIPIRDEIELEMTW